MPTVRVRIISATNLVGQDKCPLKKQDETFVRVEATGTGTNCKKRTDHAQGPSPTYNNNSQFEIDLRDVNTNQLKISVILYEKGVVYDSEHVIGSCGVSCDGLAKGVPQPHNDVLLSGSAQSSISFELTAVDFGLPPAAHAAAASSRLSNSGGCRSSPQQPSSPPSPPVTQQQQQQPPVFPWMQTLPPEITDFTKHVLLSEGIIYERQFCKLSHKDLEDMQHKGGLNIGQRIMLEEEIERRRGNSAEHQSPQHHNDVSSGVVAGVGAAAGFAAAAAAAASGSPGATTTTSTVPAAQVNLGGGSPQQQQERMPAAAAAGPSASEDPQVPEVPEGGDDDDSGSDSSGNSAAAAAVEGAADFHRRLEQSDPAPATTDDIDAFMQNVGNNSNLTVDSVFHNHEDACHFSLLLSAIKAGNATALAHIIEKHGADPNCSTKVQKHFRATPLVRAIEKADVECVRVLARQPTLRRNEQPPGRGKTADQALQALLFSMRDAADRAVPRKILELLGELPSRPIAVLDPNRLGASAETETTPGGGGAPFVSPSQSNAAQNASRKQQRFGTTTSGADDKNASALNVQPRPNPAIYMVIVNGYHVPLPAATAESINEARAAGKTGTMEVAIKYQDMKGNPHAVKRDISLQFEQDPNIPTAGVSKNGTTVCHDFVPRWFYLDNEQCWSPVSAKADYDLTVAKAANKTVVDRRAIDDREYDLLNYSQTNKSGTMRPMLHLREDGTSVRGECVATWAYFGVERGVDSTLPLPFAIAEALDKAYTGGASGTVKLDKVPMQLRKGDDNTTVDVKAASIEVNIVPGAATHGGSAIASGFAYKQSMKFVRYFPSYFYWTDDCRWASFSCQLTATLDSAAGKFSVKHRDRDYDLARLEQLNTESGKVRPITSVRGRTGQGASSTPAMHTGEFAEIFKRVDMITDNTLSKAELKARIANTAKYNDIDRLLYFCNGLVNHYKFVIKGGILRDAVVRNDISKSDDIDIELPPVFQQYQLQQWISQFLYGLDKDFGVRVDASDPKGVRVKDTNDLFGPTLARQTIVDGKVTIPVLLPCGRLRTSLECITPWNTAYNPPQNMDVSVNNLRVVASGGRGELCQSVPLSKTNTMFATLSYERFSVQDIMRQIVAGEASPCYDYEWVDGDDATGKTGEGRNRNKWCEAFHPMSALRQQSMLKRFTKIRSKGYRMVPPPVL